MGDCLFYVGSFSKFTKVFTNLGQLVSPVTAVYQFQQNMGLATFWATFYKLIWSPVNP
jgi:hypothetical protein